jgi:hypothetical protein
MARPSRSRWLTGWLLAALPFAACAGGDASLETGELRIQLELANGIEIDEVTYTITGNGMDPMVGTVNTSAPGSTASFEIYGLLPGEGYEIMLSAVSTDGETSCSGSAPFDVAAGVTTEVAVMLNCQPAEELGGVRVSGKFNFCAQLTKVVVSPLQTSIGNQIKVLAEGKDFENDPVEYLWTGTGGSFADPMASQTTYTCQQVGEQTITITVSDDGFDYCDANWTVDVTCVDGTGGGGAGGSGGVAGGGGTGGTAGAGGTAGTGGTAGSGGTAGTGGMGGTAGTGGTGGMAGTGGTGGSVCIPDGGAVYAGEAVNRPCGCDAMEVCVDETCQPAALVFLSSTLSDAALGGPRGADETCAELAEAAGLGGYWFSWTSDGCTSPSKRFEKSTLPYRMIDGAEVSSSWARMTMDPPPLGMGYLLNPIDMDENGDIAATPLECRSSANPPQGCFVWTNTKVEGGVAAIADHNGCLGLTTNDSSFGPSTVGKITSVSRGWTDGSFSTCGIDNRRIYCFEQSAADPIP